MRTGSKLINCVAKLCWLAWALAATSGVCAQSGLGPQSIEVGPGQKSLVLHDIDRDGLVDLLVALEDSDEVAVARGKKGGGFARFDRFDAGPNPANIALADFNRDGSMDLAVANHEAAQLTILLGDGEGRFERSTAPVAVAVQPHPHWIEAMDFDHDGVADLVVDDRDGNGLLLLPGDGLGGFQAGHRQSMAGAPYLGFAVHDVNNDGMPDLISPNQHAVAVAVARASGGFMPAVTIDAISPFAVAAADFNGDGLVDVLSASQQGAVQMMLGVSDGWDRPLTTTVPRGAKLIATGQFDQGAISDAVIVTWTGNVSVILNGDMHRPIAWPGFGREALWGLAVADLDRDGLDDVVVGQAEGTDLLIGLNPGLQ